MAKKVRNLEKKEEKKEETKPVQPQQIKVTAENASQLGVYFLQKIFARLGYMVKLLEEMKENK